MPISKTTASSILVMAMILYMLSLAALVVLALPCLEMVTTSSQDLGAGFLMAAMAKKISCSLALEAIQSQIPQISRASIQ
ncbi:hypothetical protein [Cylindrospermum sp. FACHB-282]|uniref:hypothetical protein n=1 Tax=Cylindrospermum sp. FACHB-282 TaxID=2692794 RepID=UPI001685D2C9|nr:hypothetical protein [Cylindrospermum sp. FACHB-282]MBD2385530.1 hypothetical protein [Cylindrospermum sp. FACHB-282]